MTESTLKPIREVYGVAEKDDDDSSYFYCPGGYGPMLESIAPVILQKDDDDYQGSSYVLYRDDDRWGYLTFGWGSCSGCDALEGSESWNDVEELRQDMVKAIHWEDDALAMLRWVANHDWFGDWSWREEAQRAFLAEATAMLAGEAFAKREDD